MNMHRSNTSTNKKDEEWYVPVYQMWTLLEGQHGSVQREESLVQRDVGSYLSHSLYRLCAPGQYTKVTVSPYGPIFSSTQAIKIQKFGMRIKVGNM